MNKIRNTFNCLGQIELTLKNNVTLSKLAYLSCLLDGPKKTAELCALMDVTQGTASRSMGDLKAAGLARQVSEGYAAPYEITELGRDTLNELSLAMEGVTKYDPVPAKKTVRYSKVYNATARTLRSMPDDVLHKVHGPAPHTRTWGF